MLRVVLITSVNLQCFLMVLMTGMPVEDVCFELLECVFVNLCLQTLVLSKGQIVWESGFDARVHIGFVIELVGNEIDGFKLVGVTRW